MLPSARPTCCVLSWLLITNSGLSYPRDVLIEEVDGFGNRNERCRPESGERYSKLLNSGGVLQLPSDTPDVLDPFCTNWPRSSTNDTLPSRRKPPGRYCDALRRTE